MEKKVYAIQIGDGKGVLYFSNLKKLYGYYQIEVPKYKQVSYSRIARKIKSDGHFIQWTSPGLTISKLIVQ